jgi:hypothetical protein
MYELLSPLYLTFKSIERKNLKIRHLVIKFIVLLFVFTNIDLV